MLSMKKSIRYPKDLYDWLVSHFESEGLTFSAGVIRVLSMYKKMIQEEAGVRKKGYERNIFSS